MTRNQNQNQYHISWPRMRAGNLAHLVPVWILFLTLSLTCGCAQTDSHLPVAWEAPKHSWATERSQSLVSQAADAYRAGDPQAAWKMLRQARRVDPRETSGLGLAVIIARDLNLQQEQLLAVTEWGAAEPQHAPTQHRVGLELLHLGHTTDGIRHLEWAQHLAPSDTVIRRDLAAAYCGQENIAAALNVLRQGLERQPREESLTQALAKLTGQREPLAEVSRAHQDEVTVASAPTLAEETNTSEPIDLAGRASVDASEEADEAIVTAPDSIQLVAGVVPEQTPVPIPKKVRPGSKTSGSNPATSNKTNAAAQKSGIVFTAQTKQRPPQPLRITPANPHAGPVINPRYSLDRTPIPPDDQPLTVPIAREQPVELKITPRVYSE